MNKKFFLIFSLFFLFFVNHISQAANYYWIGGSGNWSDISHWATASGGNTPHLQVPQPADDVFFDANSFTAPGETVTVNVGNAVCRNMDWSGALYNPAFAGASGIDFRIFGSLTLIGAMDFSFAGTVSFEANIPGQTITSNGKQFNNYVYFNGIGGGWNIMDAFVTSGWIQQQYGTLNTNSHDITCSAYYSNNSNTRSLLLGASEVTITGSTWSWWMSSTNMTFDAGTSHIYFTSASSPGMRYSSNCQFHNVSFTNPAAGADIISMTNAQFNTLFFAGSANINGSHIIGTLTFSAGKTYVLESTQTLTINTNFIANGTCQSPIFFYSTNTGNHATISKSSGSITIDRVIMKDIHASGGAVFTANNSADLGNNTGWTINPATPNNLYWVGGTGNWDDTSHWSFTSGGTGGACVPTPYDDVFFDVNSFSTTGQSVTISPDHAFCRDMTWTGALYNPVLAGPSDNNLHIFGSLVFISAMNISFNGYAYFESKLTGKTITSATQQFKNYVYFDGIGGGWTFLDEFNTTSWIQLVNGAVNTNSQPVFCSAVYSNNSNTRGLVLGASVITISGSTWSWWVSANNLTFDCGTSLIRFTSASSPGMRYSNNMVFYDVEWTDPAATGDMISMTNAGFNSMTWAGNGNISGNHTYGTLSFSGAKEYILASGSTQTITNILIANGACTGYIFIYATNPGSFASFSKAGGTVNVDFVILKDIHATGGALFTANNSVDLGNNTGWVINPYPSQDLYWVSDAGNWTDPSHWAFSSGGAGGACIPTPNDNVFFDVNSFSATGQTVTINIGSATCHNMSWNGALYNPTFAGPSANKLMIYGSLEFTTAMNLTFQGNVYFESTVTGETIFSSGQQFKNYVYFSGVGGGWTFLDAFSTTGWIQHQYGTLNTGSRNVTCSAYYSNNSNIRSLMLGSSLITVTGSTWSWWMSNTNMTFDAGTSLIRFTSGSSPGMRYANNCTFHRVIFTNSLSTADIISMTGAFFTSLTFKGDGNINGAHTYDTLTFSPGMTYHLQSNQTQTVIDEFHIRGNGCFPITLKSTTPGVQSTVFKAGGNVSGEYIEMSDQNATGGAIFYAGDHSSDVINNTGWIFTNSPNYIFGLGFDTIICPGYSIILNTVNFNGGISFLWYDNGTAPTDTITGPGTYWVTVTYDNACFITDSIIIGPCPSLIQLNFNSANVNCEGDTNGWATVIASNGVPPYSYQWSTGSTNDTIFNLAPGVYTVTVSDIAMNTAIDSVVIVALNPIPVISILPDSSVICYGDSIQLAASGAANYSWAPSSGLSNTTIADPFASPAGTTTYTVTGEAAGCYGTATAVVEVLPAPVVTISPANPFICNAGSVQLVAGGADTYLWTPAAGLDSTDIATPAASPASTTTYTVTGFIGGCSASQSVTVTVGGSPLITANPTLPTVCGGDSIQLSASGGNTYLWTPSAGLDSAMVATPLAGPSSTTTYTVTGDINGCTGSATVTVSVIPLPNVSILPASDTLCTGDSISLEASGADFYAWIPAAGLNDTSIYNPVASPVTTTSYTVTGTTVGCENTATVTISVAPLPVLQITPSAPSYCTGDSVQLLATGASVFLWTPAAGLSQTDIPDPVANPLTTTVYTVTGNASGCTGMTTVTVTVNSIPVVTASAADTTICLGASTGLTASGADTYVWSPAGTLNDHLIATPVATPVATTVYFVTGTSLGCSGISTVTIYVNPVPVIGAVVEEESCIGANDASILIILSGGTPPYIVSWDQSGNDLYIDSLTPGTYLVTVTDSNACPATRIFEIIASDESCYPPHIYVPNIFSPNGDGINDILFVRGKGIESLSFMIYDRWGEKVFETTNDAEGWDGSFRGKEMDAGTYVFYLKAKLTNSVEIKTQGSISLVR